MFQRINRRVLMKWMEAAYNDVLVIPIDMIGTVVGPLLGTIFGTIIGGKVGKAVGIKLTELTTNDINLPRIHGPYGDVHIVDRRLSARITAAMGVSAGSAVGAALGALTGSALGEMLGDVADGLLWNACTWLVDTVTVTVRKKEVVLAPEVCKVLDDHLLLT